MIYVKLAYKNVICFLKKLLKFAPTLLITLLLYLLLYFFDIFFCDDKSLCYTIVIFLIGIIITLKINLLDSSSDYIPIFRKMFDENRRIDSNSFKYNEMIALKLGAFSNVLVFIIAFWYDVQKKEREAILLLNALIIFNFVIMLRNIIITFRMYSKRINIPNLEERAIENNSKDLFEKWLLKRDECDTINVALTDKSYKNKYLRENKEKYEKEINKDLSTYGDAIIKICYIELLYGNTDKLFVKKSKYESDEYFVDKVARHYKLIDYIKFDDGDDNIKKDYDFITPEKTSGGNKKDPGTI